MISNRTIRFPAIAIFSLLLLISLGLAYLIANQGLSLGLLVMMGILGLLLVVAIVKEYRIGFYFIFFMGLFMFYVDRIGNVEFPMGTVYDALVGLVFFALFMDQKNHDWTLFKNPVTIVFVIINFIPAPATL